MYIKISKVCNKSGCGYCLQPHPLDLSSLLVLLGLEKYESNFAEEEVSWSDRLGGVDPVIIR